MVLTLLIFLNRILVQPRWRRGWFQRNARRHCAGKQDQWPPFPSSRRGDRESIHGLQERAHWLGRERGREQQGLCCHGRSGKEQLNLPSLLNLLLRLSVMATDPDIFRSSTCVMLVHVVKDHTVHSQAYAFMDDAPD